MGEGERGLKCGWSWDWADGRSCVLIFPGSVGVSGTEQLHLIPAPLPRPCSPSAGAQGALGSPGVPAGAGQCRSSVSSLL